MITTTLLGGPLDGARITLQATPAVLPVPLATDRISPAQLAWSVGPPKHPVSAAYHLWADGSYHHTPEPLAV